MVLSSEQVINLSFEIIWILLIAKVWAFIVFKHLPVSIFHIFNKPIASPLISLLLPGKFLIQVTDLVWPTKVLIHLFESRSQSLIVLSTDPLNTF